MIFDELRAAFGQVEREVFRLEVQQSYAGVADPGWEAWQAGRPLPQRTADNNPWLAETYVSQRDLALKHATASPVGGRASGPVEWLTAEPGRYLIIPSLA